MSEHASHVEAAASAASAAIAGWASKSTYAGAGAIGLGWFLSSEFTVLVGLLLGLGGFLVNWYYKAREDRRSEREHQQRMRTLDSKGGPPP